MNSNRRRSRVIEKRNTSPQKKNSVTPYSRSIDYKNENVNGLEEEHDGDIVNFMSTIEFGEVFKNVEDQEEVDNSDSKLFPAEDNMWNDDFASSISSIQSVAEDLQSIGSNVLGDSFNSLRIVTGDSDSDDEVFDTRIIDSINSDTSPLMSPTGEIMESETYGVISRRPVAVPMTPKKTPNRMIPLDSHQSTTSPSSSQRHIGSISPNSHLDLRSRQRRQLMIRRTSTSYFCSPSSPSDIKEKSGQISSPSQDQKTKPSNYQVSPKRPPPLDCIASKVSSSPPSEDHTRQRRHTLPLTPIMTVENYKKSDLIGLGANARVYLGFNLDNGRFLAIKEITFANISTEALETRLALIQREISLMKGLSHQNIVQYYGAESLGTTLNIFLEYVPGGSLAHIISRFGRLSEDVAKQYTRQILLGLSYLHDNGIVHRDIKGSNILASVDGILKLADFGASRQIADVLTLSDGFKTLIGTPNWMAPEVIMQTGHGRKADIWSVGCTVLEMVTGKTPFSEFTTAAAVMFHIASGTSLPHFPDFLSAAAVDFLKRCFVRDPQHRATAEELLRHSWLHNVVTPLEHQHMLYGSLTLQEHDRSYSPVAKSKHKDTPRSSSGAEEIPERKISQREPSTNPIFLETSTLVHKPDDQQFEQYSSAEQQQQMTPRSGFDSTDTIQKYLQRQNSEWQSRSMDRHVLEEHRQLNEEKKSISQKSPLGRFHALSDTLRPLTPRNSSPTDKRKRSQSYKFNNRRMKNSNSNLEDQPVGTDFAREALEKERLKMEQKLSKQQAFRQEMEKYAQEHKDELYEVYKKRKPETASSPKRRRAYTAPPGKLVQSPRSPQARKESSSRMGNIISSRLAGASSHRSTKPHTKVKP